MHVVDYPGHNKIFHCVGTLLYIHVRIYSYSYNIIMHVHLLT